MSALKDRYINPLTDFGFKKLFGTEPNKILLVDFLNQILPPRHQIVDLSFFTSTAKVLRGSALLWKYRRPSKITSRIGVFITLPSQSRSKPEKGSGITS